MSANQLGLTAQDIADLVPQSAAKTASTLDFIYTMNKNPTDVTFTVE